MSACVLDNLFQGCLHRDGVSLWVRGQIYLPSRMVGSPSHPAHGDLHSFQSSKDDVLAGVEWGGEVEQACLMSLGGLLHHGIAPLKLWECGNPN